MAIGAEPAGPTVYGADPIDPADAEDHVEDLAPSLRWLGRVVVWAVELTMHGAVVPLLGQRKRGRNRANESVGSYSVRWTPALVDPALVCGPWPRPCPVPSPPSMPR